MSEFVVGDPAVRHAEFLQHVPGRPDHDRRAAEIVINGGGITVVQGEDMGCRSLLDAEIPAALGGSIRVAGQVRCLEA